ncbi:hypothetical protein [Winogradskyella sp. Asnod2-B02-A]|uniref:hypothetical protein n=1 Tax=Winogradskyella sp. Asnod2-B02-A TaxID=3160583 RepID=UPI00386B7960
MTRLLHTIVFLLLTTITYGQKSTLFQNVNVRANELKHNLNEAGDSIIFKCERTVYEVVIFNDDFERVIKVRDTDAVIPIADIPVGRYIVEALLSDKLIVITLLRNESFNLPKQDDLVADSSDLFGKKTAPKKEVVASIEPSIETLEIEVEEEAEIVAENVPPLNNDIFGEESNIKKTDLAVAGKKAEPKPKPTVAKEPKKSSLSLFNTKAKPTTTKPKRSTRVVDAARANRIVSTYWVEYKINNGQSSQKIQKLGDQETVDRMIRKIEIDMKTKAGRLNELTVWTVYDPPKFVEHKRLNKTDFTKVASESFKMKPYYKKVNETEASDL